MMKRVISLSVCLLILLSVFAGCQKKDEDDLGAYVTMYLTERVYSFDPAYAYENEATLKLVSLMFDPLFVLDENGKVKGALAEDYKIDKETNSMTIILGETAWSDGTAVTANDVVYTWKRLLDVSNSFEAAALLFDIKNARAAKEGEESIDDVGIQAQGKTGKELLIQFNEGVDYDRFLLNLTSYALAPLRENIVNQTFSIYDWAKSPAVFYASGPFKLREVSFEKADARLVFERNNYYYRDVEEDAIDEAVRPYRLIVDYTKSEEQILEAYNNGEIFYIGDVPLSIRGQVKDIANVTDALSTHTYVLNENAIIRLYKGEKSFEALNSKKSVYEDGLREGIDGDKIFAIPEVRQALSLAIDRQAIADAIVFAKAATGLVPYGVFETDSDKELFREIGGDILSTSANVAKAKEVLANAKLNGETLDPTKYMFAISVAGYDTVHVKIAEMVQAAWSELGFHVALNPLAVANNPEEHIDKTTTEPVEGIVDDIFAESYTEGRYDVAAIDNVAYCADAYSMLAPFAKYFTGGAATKPMQADFFIPTHRTGYENEAYNAKIEEVAKATDAEARAKLLHEAEAILMEDLPVIPIIFNQNATLISEDLSKYEFTYYGTPMLAKLKQKDYHLYVPVEEE